VDYIFGYTILNDWSARYLQRKESKIGLGPAKGKDFATSLGPYLVTKDELAPYRIAGRPRSARGHWARDLGECDRITIKHP
jgi:fumarylacetoacetate (FAA) hydrolase